MSGWEKGNQGCSVGNRFRCSAAVFKGVSNFPQSSNDFSRLPFSLMERNAFPWSVMLEKIIHIIHVNRPELWYLLFKLFDSNKNSPHCHNPWIHWNSTGPGKVSCCKVTSQVWSIYLRVLSWNNGAEQYWRTEMTSIPTDIGIIYNRTSVDATNLY